MTELKNIIQNKNSTAELIDDNIFFIKYHENTYSEVSDFKEGYAAYDLLGDGEPLKVLAEMCKNAEVSSDARKYAQENKMPAIAEALVLHSMSQRIIFKLYNKFRKQSHPLRVFKDFASAYNWLKVM